MPDKFAVFVRKLGFEAVPCDLDSQKPDTLSFELASFVSQVERFTRIEAINGRDQRLNLHVGVSNELDGNAFASAKDGDHYAGITFGHFLASSYHSIQAFFLTNAFHDIGTPPGNDGSALELCPQNYFWSVDGLKTITAMADIDTNDLPRIWGAYYLNYAMTMLAFHHELFHVYLGHCPVMNELGLRGRIMEVGHAEISDTDGKISRALEIAADQNAITLLTTIILRGSDLPTRGKVVTMDISNKLRLMLVAAGLLTTSWFAWQKRLGLKGHSHPEPGKRFLNFYRTTEGALSAHGQGSLFKQVAGSAIEDLAMISRRCADLATAMSSIANGSPRNRGTEPLPSDIVKSLKVECFRSV